MKLPLYIPNKRFGSHQPQKMYESWRIDPWLSRLFLYLSKTNYIAPKSFLTGEFVRRVNYFQWLGFNPWKARLAVFFPPKE